MIRGKNRRYGGQALRRSANIGPGGANRIGTRTPLVPSIGTPASTSQTITFTQPVVLKGVPAWYDTSTPTITVDSATRPTPTTVVLVWNAAPTAALTVPFEDPSIRNMAGGYVASGNFTFS
jgi:hypothetical protein